MNIEFGTNVLQWVFIVYINMHGQFSNVVSKFNLISVVWADIQHMNTNFY